MLLSSPHLSKALVACASLLLATQCTQKPLKFAGGPVKKPIAVVLRVSDQAAAANDMGGIAAIVEAVTERLTDEGLQHQLYLGEGDAPPPPRVDIEVVLWNPGDEELRRQGTAVGLLGPLSFVGGVAGGVMSLAGAGSVVVDCQAYAEGSTKPTYQNRFQRSLVSVAVNAQQDVGEFIGNRIGSELIVGLPRDGRFGP